MQAISLPGELAAGLTARSDERRKKPRFDMRFPVHVRALGDPWITTETADVSTTGAMFVTQCPFLLNAPVEYILGFPPELTKAPQPLLVRFFGTVVRCENVPDGNGHYGVAVRNSGYRYLSREEASGFKAVAAKPSPSVNLATAGGFSRSIRKATEPPLSRSR
jgi:hypothetical protein